MVIMDICKYCHTHGLRYLMAVGTPLFFALRTELFATSHRIGSACCLARIHALIESSVFRAPERVVVSTRKSSYESGNMSTSGSQMPVQEAVADTLYHLGKGLWKSVPIVGPLIIELVYEQYRDRLLSQVSELDVEQLNAQLALLPSKDEIERLERAVDQLTDSEKATVSASAVQAMSSSASELRKLSDRMEGVEEGLGTIRSVLRELGKDLLSEGQLKELMCSLDQRKREWHKRISKNQRDLLASVSTNFTPYDSIKDLALNVVPDCRDRELRFRLHELEWLDLVERRAGSDDWEYRRIDELPAGRANAAE